MTEQTVSPTEERERATLNLYRRLQPAGENILVEMDKADDITAGGIILPDRAKEAPVSGVILAVGPDVGKMLHLGDEPTDLIGRRIVMQKFALTSLNGKDDCPIRYMNFKDIGALFPKE